MQAKFEILKSNIFPANFGAKSELFFVVNIKLDLLDKNIDYRIKTIRLQLRYDSGKMEDLKIDLYPDTISGHMLLCKGMP